MDKIKVLIIDDSAFFRALLSQILSEDDELVVIGTASDPIIAMEKIRQEPPDVITLDVEMPRMDGLTFLEQLMRTNPMPVLMVSSKTERGCEVTLRALELGAVDFVTKGTTNIRENLGGLKQELISKVKNAARANLKGSRGWLHPRVESPIPVPAQGAKYRLVIIGASTGGVIAVKQVLATLQVEQVAVLVVQHMAEGYTATFAKSLATLVNVPAAELKFGEVLKSGHIYVAPGSKNTFIGCRGNELVAVLKSPEKDDFYVPSVNKAFESAAKVVGSEAIGVILTGMGDDGAKGILAIKSAGGRTIAQSRETSMIFGMPRRALELGGVEFVEDLDFIGKKINSLL